MNPMEARVVMQLLCMLCGKGGASPFGPGLDMRGKSPCSPSRSLSRLGLCSALS